MLSPQAAYHLRKALWWTCVFGGCAAVGAAVAGGWRASLGVLGGAASMAGALEISALRSIAMFSGGNSGLRNRALVARGLWLVSSLAVLWVLVKVVSAPGWSLAVGVTTCVAGSVAGFLSKAPEEKG